ncbi:hypothetical protein HN51_042898 [Arachis hypogaea]
MASLTYKAEMLREEGTMKFINGCLTLPVIPLPASHRRFWPLFPASYHVIWICPPLVCVPSSSTSSCAFLFCLPSPSSGLASDSSSLSRLWISIYFCSDSVYSGSSSPSRSRCLGWSSTSTPPLNLSLLVLGCFEWP